MKIIIYNLLFISFILYRICIVFIFGFNVKKNFIGYIVFEKIFINGFIYICL